MDFPTIGAAIASAKAAAELLGNAVKLKLENDTLALINEARGKVYDIQGDLLKTNEQLFELQKQNQDLQKIIQAHENWEKEKAEYRLVNTEGGAAVYESLHSPAKHFACPSCYAKKILVPLQTLNRHYYKCPTCNESYCIKPFPNSSGGPGGGSWMTA